MTQAGLDFIANHEGCVTKAMWDVNGYAIGYGNHYYKDGSAVKKDDTITKEAAKDLFKYKIEKEFEPYVSKLVTSNINDSQKIALVSFCYNVGTGNFKNSNLLKKVNSDPNDRAIADEFAKWNKAKGKVLPALTRRRSDESNLYFSNSPLPSGGGTTTSTGVTVPSDINNMFSELATSSEWTMTAFKSGKQPKKSNRWSTLGTGKTHPKVGDLLFGYHDGNIDNRHDHVAIYLGMHGGHHYVAEGLSVDGKNINNKDKNVHAAKLEDSRFGLESDVITHFAHCTSVEIQQTPDKKVETPAISQQPNAQEFNYKYAPVEGEANIKHFTLTGNYGKGRDLYYSSTARKNNINNKPTDAHRKSLVNLANYVLDPLYEASVNDNNGEIFLNCAYRSSEVNSKLKDASTTSQHMVGEAADIRCSGSGHSAKVLRLAQLVLLMEKQGGFEYDQMILEHVDSATSLKPTFLHISFKKDGNRHYGDKGRAAKLEYFKDGKYVPLTPEQVLGTSVPAQQNGLVVIPITSNGIHLLRHYQSGSKSVMNNFPDPDTSSGLTYTTPAAFTNANGHIEGLHVSEGKCYRDINKTFSGGFIYKRNGSFQFFSSGSEYNKAVFNDITGGEGSFTQGCNAQSILMSFTNFCMIYNGKITWSKGVDSSCHFRSIGEINGRLYMFVADNTMSYKTFLNKLVELGVRNAIYQDAAANWEYGWWKTSQTTINGSASKIKNGVYYWKGLGKQNGFTWSNAIYT